MEAAVSVTDSAPALAHDDYTPKPGEAFTRAKAEAFFARYGAEIEAASRDVQHGLTEFTAYDNLYTADDLMNWSGVGSPFVRGQTDDEILVGYVGVVDLRTHKDTFVPIRVHFESERVYADTSRLDG